MTIRRLGQIEFIVLIAMLFACIAFSVDTMLPGLPLIGEELSPEALNQAQYVVTSFVLGMGIGTLIVGSISDTFGRKPVIIGAALFYFVGAYICYRAQSIEVLIGARMMMGFGASGPRAVGLAIVRDLYSGREMARIMSFAMMVFSLVPAIAPLFGSFIIDLWGWREIFLGFIGFTAIAVGWFALRQPETLPLENRKALDPRLLWLGVRELFGNRSVVLSILVMSFCFGLLFANLVTIQPVFDVTFGKAAAFPWWFALIAILAMSASIINASLLDRLGMRFLITAAVLAQALFASAMALATWAGVWPDWLYFPAYFVWTLSVFWMMGFTIGNLNALALEPLGHIAGLAASVISSAATVLAVFVAAPIGLAFDGTPLPVMIGTAASAFIAFGLMRALRTP